MAEEKKKTTKKPAKKEANFKKTETTSSKKKTEGSRKKGIIGLIVIVLIILLIILCSGLSSKSQTSKLNNRVNEIASMNTLTEDYSELKTKTSGDYGKIEEAIKNFFVDYSAIAKTLEEDVNNQSTVLNEVFDAVNYEMDGPDFSTSLQKINEASEKFNEDITAAETILSEESIMARIQEAGVSEDIVAMYRNYFYGESGLNTKVETETVAVASTKSSVTNAYDQAKTIIEFLIENKDHWTIKNENISFDNLSLTAQYNTLKAGLIY